jgi:hypothetical protein
MYLDRPVSHIEDEDIGQLIDEMSHASGIGSAFQNFVPFLISCQYPGGAGTVRVPFHLNRTRPGFLETRLDKIPSRAIQQLCGELAAIIHEPLEMHINRKLMTFLNHVVRSLEQQGKRIGRKR